MSKSLISKKLVAIATVFFAATSILSLYSNTMTTAVVMSYVLICGFALTYLIKVENLLKISLGNFFNIRLSDPLLFQKKKNMSPDEFVNTCCADSKISIPTREDIISQKNSFVGVFNSFIPLATVMTIFSIASFIFSSSVTSPDILVTISMIGFPPLALAFLGRKKSLQQEIAKVECGFKEGPEWYFGFLEHGLDSSEHADMLKKYIDGVRAQGRNLTNMEFALLSDFGKSNDAFDGDLKNRPI